MALIVQKYGGTSVANPDRIANVANRVVKSWEQGHRMVVVLSAMSGETDRLIRLAKELAEDPDARELDVLFATGEQVSVSLFSIVLRAQGIKATSLLGHQARSTPIGPMAGPESMRSIPAGSWKRLKKN